MLTDEQKQQLFAIEVIKKSSELGIPGNVKLTEYIMQLEEQVAAIEFVYGNNITDLYKLVQRLEDRCSDLECH